VLVFLFCGINKRLYTAMSSMQRRSNAPQVSDDNNVALKQCSLESIFLLQYAIYPIKKQIFWMNIKRLRNGRKYAGKNTTHITSN